jgi:hypothetical protein
MFAGLSARIGSRSVNPKLEAKTYPLTHSFNLHNSTFNFIYTLLLQNAAVASNVPARCKYALHLHFWQLADYQQCNKF